MNHDGILFTGLGFTKCMVYIIYTLYIVSWDLLNLRMDKEMNPCGSDFSKASFISKLCGRP